MAVLRTAIDASVTVIPLLSCSFSSASGVVLIESEKVHYSHATDNSLLGCTRGYAGTSAATHVVGKPVTFVSADVIPDALDVDEPSIVASLNVTAVAADVAPTAIFVPTVSGLYGISVYSVCTASATGGDAAPTLLAQWTDETGLNQWYIGSPLGANATLINYGTRPVWCVAGNPINYYTTSGVYAATLRYNFHFVVTKL